MYVGRFESAVEDFEAIIGIEPDNAAARAAGGLARASLRPQRRADVRAEGALSARCPYFADVEDGR